jgi:hypothetical protein
MHSLSIPPDGSRTHQYKSVHLTPVELSNCLYMSMDNRMQNTLHLSLCEINIRSTARLSSSLAEIDWLKWAVGPTDHSPQLYKQVCSNCYTSIVG